MNTAQIRQPNVLTYSLHQWFPKLISNNQPWLFFVVSILVSLPSISVAQSLGTLPPPPPLQVPKNAVPHTSVEAILVSPAPPMSVREYTFQAPTSTPSSVPVSPRSSTSPYQFKKTPSLYRVEVVGKNTSVLSQVQSVEPLAFIRQSEGVIHAGIFKQSQQAQKRVVELQRKGLSASVVQVYEGGGRRN